MEVPVALRMPISRDFWMTDTPSTLAIPSATASTTRIWIIQLEADWERRPTSSCRLSSIQLSAERPWRRSISRASRSASKISSTLTSMVVAPPGMSSRVCAERSGTNTHRAFTSLLPRSKTPETVNTSPRPSGVAIRTLSPTPIPRSAASTVPTIASDPSSAKRPAFILGTTSMTRTKLSGSMPRSVTDLVAGPRVAKAAPAAVGVAATTPGMVAIEAITCCHCSMERIRSGTFST